VGLGAEEAVRWKQTSRSDKIIQNKDTGRKGIPGWQANGGGVEGCSSGC
jgi:hypothetical protein